jgi:putative transposase
MHYTYILFRSIAKESITALISFYKKKSYVSIWNWIQHYKPERKLHRKRKRIYEFVVDDETLIKVGDEFV